MAVGESTRSQLWNLLKFLGWWEVISGVAIFVIVVLPTRTLSSHLPKSHHELLYVFYVEILVGVASAVVAAQGVIVSHASLHNPLLPSTVRAFNAWMVIGTALVISLIAVLFVIPAAIEGGRKEILEIIEGGLGYYLSDIEWKISLDKLHQEFQCCGINSIADWYQSRWIPVRSFRPEVADLREILLEDGILGPRVVPASCCNPDASEPCFHDTLQQNSSSDATLYPRTLFTRGCGEFVVNPVVATVGPVKVLAITALLLQAGQLFIGWYLYIEARSSDRTREELKKRKKRKKPCKQSPGSPCSSGKTPPHCRTCTRRCESPKTPIGSRAGVLKSPTKIGQAVKNFAIPFGKAESPRKYDVFCASVTRSEPSFVCSEEELVSIPTSIEWHAKKFGEHDFTATSNPGASTLSETENRVATERLLEEPILQKKWWEPELDLLKLDF